MTLFDRVVEFLDARGIPAALIGASALAAHGVSRSTFDRDLLTSQAAVVDESFWKDVAAEADIDVRRGDAADPLAGVVRFSRDGERDVDLVVISSPWIGPILERAVAVSMPTRSIRVVEPADLILLKLYAGGAQDRWDIEQLLALDRDGVFRRLVNARLAALPSRCAVLWEQLGP